MNHSEARIVARLAAAVFQQYVSANGCFKGFRFGNNHPFIAAR